MLNDSVKTYISNLVRTMRFWDNYIAVGGVKHRIPNQAKSNHSATIVTLL